MTIINSGLNIINKSTKISPSYTKAEGWNYVSWILARVAGWSAERED